jgi:hypothetical protein
LIKIDLNPGHWVGRLLLVAITIFLWRFAYSKKIKSQFVFLAIAGPAILLSFFALYYVFNGLGILDMH